MEDQVDLTDHETDHDICIPPLLSLEHVIAIYCEEIYILCGSNINQASMILEISEKQLIEFLSEELDFS